MGGGPKRVDQYLECCTNTRQNKCPRAQKVEQIDSAVFITDFILELSKNGRIPCGGDPSAYNNQLCKQGLGSLQPEMLLSHCCHTI